MYCQTKCILHISCIPAYWSIKYNSAYSRIICSMTTVPMERAINWLILQDGDERQVAFNFDSCSASEADIVIFVSADCSKPNTIEAEIRLTDKNSNLSIRCSSLNGNDGSLYIHIEGDLKTISTLYLIVRSYTIWHAELQAHEKLNIYYGSPLVPNAI